MELERTLRILRETEPRRMRISVYKVEPPESLFRRVSKHVSQALLGMCINNRETATAYFMCRAPESEQRVTAIYRCRQAAKQIQNVTSRDTHRPCQHLLGPIPGNRMRSLSDSRQSMPALAEEVRRFIDAACDPARLAGKGAVANADRPSKTEDGKIGVWDTEYSV
jgi:hypothetical protein